MTHLNSKEKNADIYPRSFLLLIGHYILFTINFKRNFYSVNFGLNNRNPILIPKFHLLTDEL